MTTPYYNEVNELCRWIDNVNQILSSGGPMLIPPNVPPSVKKLIGVVSNGIKVEYPYYSSELMRISSILFQQKNIGTYTINPFAFGELFTIVHHIQAEPINMQLWATIHDRVSNVALNLYRDGHWTAAAEKAIKEVETRFKEVNSSLSRGLPSTAKLKDIITGLLREGGAFEFCHDMTISGQDYRRGVQALFEGAFAAYRNPAAHANVAYSRREAIEQIVLASQLMYILEKTLNTSYLK